jgi:hypothetical protein
VQKLGASIGDHLLVEQQAIIDNSFDGDEISKEREDIAMKEILSVLAPRDICAESDEEDSL